MEVTRPGGATQRKPHDPWTTSRAGQIAQGTQQCRDAQQTSNLLAALPESDWRLL